MGGTGTIRVFLSSVPWFSNICHGKRWFSAVLSFTAAHSIAEHKVKRVNPVTCWWSCYWMVQVASHSFKHNVLAVHSNVNSHTDRCRLTFRFLLKYVECAHVGDVLLSSTILFTWLLLRPVFTCWERFMCFQADVSVNPLPRMNTTRIHTGRWIISPTCDISR